MFDYMAPVYNGGVVANGVNVSAMPEGYRSVRAGTSRFEWLKLKDGMGALASALETERMNAYVGGSNEWTKAEGVAYDWRTREAYVALTSVVSPMLDASSTELGAQRHPLAPEQQWGSSQVSIPSRVAEPQMPPPSILDSNPSWEGSPGTTSRCAGCMQACHRSPAEL